MAIVTFTYPGRAVTRGCPHMAVWLPLLGSRWKGRMAKSGPPTALQFITLPT